MRDTADWYRSFAEHEARGRSTIYERWAAGIAQDAPLLALIDELPETSRQPSLVFAVARLLGAPETDFAAFKDWLPTQWSTARPAIAARFNQTNEPARCAALLPALAGLPGPLALLEIGASAGLCLYPDQYSYAYDDAPVINPSSGQSTVLLHCKTNGRVPLPERMPRVLWRAGIDLAPLDVNDAQDRRWLETLAWPEENERRARIRAAIEIARRDPPELVMAQAVDALLELAAQVPAGSTLVVVTSGVLVYLPFLERERFCGVLRELTRTTGARWLSLEGIDVLPRVREALPTGAERFVLALDEHPLAWCGPHGQSLDWL